MIMIIDEMKSYLTMRQLDGIQDLSTHAQNPLKSENINCQSGEKLWKVSSHYCLFNLFVGFKYC